MENSNRNSAYEFSTLVGTDGVMVNVETYGYSGTSSNPGRDFTFHIPLPWGKVMDQTNLPLVMYQTVQQILLFNLGMITYQRERKLLPQTC